MCTRERTLQFRLTEEEREGRGEFSRTKRTRVVERGVKRAVAENAQFHARASLSRRAESAILARAGSGVVENAYPPLRPLPRRERPGPTLFANQRAESELSAGVQVIVEILESWWRRVAFTRFRYDDSLLCGEARSRLTAIYEPRGEKEK